MSLLDYWEEHPPVHILVQGIASGLSGTQVGRSSKKPAETPVSQHAEPPVVHKEKHVETAEELIGILGGAGMNFGSYTLPKSAKLPETFNG